MAKVEIQIGDEVVAVDLFDTLDKLVEFDRRHERGVTPDDWDEVAAIIQPQLTNTVTRSAAIQFYKELCALVPMAREHQRQLAMLDCRLAYFYKIDPRTMSAEEKRAWDDNRVAVWAENILRFGDVSGYSLASIKSLTAAAYGPDSQVWKKIYADRLLGA